MTTAVLELGSDCVIEIQTLPGQQEWRRIPQLVIAEDPTLEGLAAGSIQLLEESEYGYLVQGYRGPITVEPSELFHPDAGGLSGRLRPGRATGTVWVTVLAESGAVLGEGELEVRSRKLDYLSEYRWMIQRIADESAEAVQSYFGPSRVSVFRPRTLGSAQTLYQRFAFIQSLLGSESFIRAFRQVLNRPHHAYEQRTITVNPSRGIKGSRSLIQAFVRPGARQPVQTDFPFPSVPLRIEQTRHEESLDTVPNRFVKHAFKQWSYLVREVAEALAGSTNPAALRGSREAVALREQLDEASRAPLFKEVGNLLTFPSQNTVLQRRSGYSELFRAYLQTEAAALVDWEGGSDAFGAGQKNVAALYEYWAFLELARIVEALQDFTIDRRSLFDLTGNRLGLRLQRGTPSVLRAHGHRRGRRIVLELWFNKQFTRGAGSWSETMRPDCSLRISAELASRSYEWKWLHFDAKYRVNAYTDIFTDGTNEEGARNRSELKPVSEDVLKMHAYRDAVSRSSGAFVLYPGLDEGAKRLTPYHEILPGIGAFVLRPVESGLSDPRAARNLSRFLDDAIDHLAAVGTDEDRAYFWTNRIYDERRGKQFAFRDWATTPPADTLVLFGYVHGTDHLSWIEQTGLYNLRAADRIGSVGLHSPELGAQLACLYDATSSEVSFYRLTGQFLLKTADDLIAQGYPHEPTSRLYCCLQLGEPLLPPEGLEGDLVRRLARRGRESDEWGAPRAYRLDEVLKELLQD